MISNFTFRGLIVILRIVLYYRPLISSITIWTLTRKCSSRSTNVRWHQLHRMAWSLQASDHSFGSSGRSSSYHPQPEEPSKWERKSRHRSRRIPMSQSLGMFSFVFERSLLNNVGKMPGWSVCDVHWAMDLFPACNRFFRLVELVVDPCLEQSEYHSRWFG